MTSPVEPGQVWRYVIRDSILDVWLVLAPGACEQWHCVNLEDSGDRGEWHLETPREASDAPPTEPVGWERLV